jgi:hypothetical protein
MKFIFLASAFLIATSPALAKSPSGEFTVLSVGNNSCGSWTQARRSNGALAYEGWVSGYLTGFNEFSPIGDDITSGTDHAGLFAAIDKICAESPLETIADASHLLLAELMAKLGQKMDAENQKLIDDLVNKATNPKK